MAVLVVVTVLAALAAPHARPLRWPGRRRPAALPAMRLPALPGSRACRRPGLPRAARAVAFALRPAGQAIPLGRPKARHAFDCSGLTWAAWRAAGVTIPRTAAGQLAGLPRVRGRLQPGDLVIYASRGPVAPACGHGGRPGPDGRGPGPRHPGPPDRLRGGWLGAVRPGGRPMTAAFLDFLGWEQLTAAEQAAALAGACLGLAAWLLARALFGGRRQR